MSRCCFLFVLVDGVGQFVGSGHGGSKNQCLHVESQLEMDLIWIFPDLIWIYPDLIYIYICQ